MIFTLKNFISFIKYQTCLHKMQYLISNYFNTNQIIHKLHKSMGSDLEKAVQNINTFR